MEKIEIFINRLKRIGIDIEIWSNYPWIYLAVINGKRVIEKTDDSNHGFNIAFLPIKRDVELQFTDISAIFKLIRKYK